MKHLPKSWYITLGDEKRKKKIENILKEKGWSHPHGELDFLTRAGVKSVTNTYAGGDVTGFVLVSTNEVSAEGRKGTAKEVKLLALKISSTQEEWEKFHNIKE